MFRKIAAHLLTLIALVALATGATAAPKDKAAQKRIDQAINEHYLATDFDKAEGLLLGVIKACDEKCSPSVVAKAWMYVGIVRGSARGDVSAAQEAFQTAIETDGTVPLDEGLTTPEVRDAWVAAGGLLGGGGGVSAATGDDDEEEEPAGGGGDEDVVGNMECTPSIQELETRRPVPVSCMTDEPAKKMELLYKEFGSSEWETVGMGRAGDAWIGQIPCSATDLVGTLQWYVRAKDSDDETVDNYGSLKSPVSVEIVNGTSEPPPAYPGKDPPARCADAGECPEEMLGTPSCPGTSKDGPRGAKAWGDPCDKSQECESGLYCISGVCESAPTCDKNSDCTSNKCVDFTCDMTGVDGDGGGGGGDPPKNTIGVSFGYDLMFGPATTTACGIDPTTGAAFDANYVCSQGGAPYPGQERLVLKDAAVNGGLLMGTYRILLSYERLLWKQLAAGLRGGVALGGSPGMLPIHLEGQVKWWFGDLASPGIRGYAGIQFGMGQFDGTVVARIDDIEAVAPPQNNDVCDTTPLEAMLPAGVRCGIDGNTASAHHQLGTMFAGINVGLKGALSRNFGVVLNVNLNLPFPNFGVVIEPSAGLDVSF